MEFSVWIEQSGLTRSEVARRLRLSNGHISDLCSKRFWLTRDVAQRIWSMTDGRVTPNDFLWDEPLDNDPIGLTLTYKDGDGIILDEKKIELMINQAWKRTPIPEIDEMLEEFFFNAQFETPDKEAVSELTMKLIQEAFATGYRARETERKKNDD